MPYKEGKWSFLLSLFFAQKTKATLHGFSNRKRSCKSNKHGQVWIFRYFFRLVVDESIKNFDLKQNIRQKQTFERSGVFECNIR